MLMAWWKALRASAESKDGIKQETVAEDAKKEKEVDLSDDEKELVDIEQQITDLKVSFRYIIISISLLKYTNLNWHYLDIICNYYKPSEGHSSRSCAS